MANILRLAPGFVPPRFSVIELVAAVAGTLAWLWLVRWRTSRNRHPLWKSLVLPASGVALAWLLTMTLLLPALDYGRSPRPLMALVERHVPRGACVRAPGMTRANVAALEVFGGHQVVTTVSPQTEMARCDRSATSAGTSKPRSRCWMWCGCRRAQATIRCCWSRASRWPQASANAERRQSALTVRSAAHSRSSGMASAGVTDNGRVRSSSRITASGWAVRRGHGPRSAPPPPRPRSRPPRTLRCARPTVPTRRRRRRCGASADECARCCVALRVPAGRRRRSIAACLPEISP